MALTAAQRSALANFRQELVSGGVDAVFGPAIDAVNSAAAAQPCVYGTPVYMTFLLPDVATATYRYTTPDKIEIIDVEVIKDGANAGGTVQVKNGAATAISDAIVSAVDKTVTRAGTLDKATRTLAAGAELQITNTKAGANAACTVIVTAIRRA